MPGMSAPQKGIRLPRNQFGQIIIRPKIDPQTAHLKNRLGMNIVLDLAVTMGVKIQLSMIAKINL